MYSRLLKPPRAKSFFVFGPRGTGKTTWVKSVFPKAVYLDLIAVEANDSYFPCADVDLGLDLGAGWIPQGQRHIHETAHGRTVPPSPQRPVRMIG